MCHHIFVNCPVAGKRARVGAGHHANAGRGAALDRVSALIPEEAERAGLFQVVGADFDLSLVRERSLVPADRRRRHDRWRVVAGNRSAQHLAIAQRIADVAPIAQEILGHVNRPRVRRIAADVKLFGSRAGGRDDHCAVPKRKTICQRALRWRAFNDECFCLTDLVH